MKRVIKGGFLTLSGTIGITGTMMVAMQSPANAWVTPPGRMIISIFENGLSLPAILFLVLFVCGLFFILTDNITNQLVSSHIGN